jgi:hypothetical protein
MATTGVFRETQPCTHERKARTFVIWLPSEASPPVVRQAQLHAEHSQISTSEDGVIA